MRLPALFILALLILAALGMPARAEEGAIRIVNPDGSVTVFKMPGAELAPEQPAGEPEMKPAEPPVKKQQERPVAKPVKKIPEAKPEKVEHEEKAAPDMTAPPPEKESKPEPAPEPAKKKFPKAVKNEKPPVPAPSPVKKKAVPARVSKKGVPLPGRKPEVLLPSSMQPSAREAEKKESRRSERKADPDDVTAGTISENEAIGIAIAHAPPSRDFEVFYQMNSGRRIYAVIFNTEAGPYRVIVDAETGAILKD